MCGHYDVCSFTDSCGWGIVLVPFVNLSFKFGSVSLSLWSLRSWVLLDDLCYNVFNGVCVCVRGGGGGVKPDEHRIVASCYVVFNR